MIEDCDDPLFTPIFLPVSGRKKEGMSGQKSIVS